MVIGSVSLELVHVWWWMINDGPLGSTEIVVRITPIKKQDRITVGPFLLSCLQGLFAEETSKDVRGFSDCIDRASTILTWT